METTFKIFKRGDGLALVEPTVRRLRFANDQVSLGALQARVKALFSLADTEVWYFQYEDEDGDVVRLTEEYELEELMEWTWSHGEDSKRLIRLTLFVESAPAPSSASEEVPEVSNNSSSEETIESIGCGASPSSCKARRDQATADTAPVQHPNEIPPPPTRPFGTHCPPRCGGKGFSNVVPGVGSKVKLTGLNAQHLNNKIARVLTYSGPGNAGGCFAKASARCVVQIDGSGQQVSVPLDKVVPVIGVRAKIVGLSSASHLNGSFTTILHFDNASGRYQVQVSDPTDGQVKVVALKPQNVAVCDRTVLVRITGLVKASEHNNKTGWIVACDESKGRYDVKLKDDGGRVISVKMDNVQFL
eukprot:c17461_g1_i1.p1 GENE.c17461_g1_i1~~c17461_g1_i1.p1  ORF type:complete len:359 (+),score=83.56 c17461_g1_i1:103-1179(+)